MGRELLRNPGGLENPSVWRDATWVPTCLGGELLTTVLPQPQVHECLGSNFHWDNAEGFFGTPALGFFLWRPQTGFVTTPKAEIWMARLLGWRL